MQEPRPLTPRSPAQPLPPGPASWVASGRDLHTGVWEGARTAGGTWLVQLGRVTLKGGEREAVEGPQPRISVPPSCLPFLSCPSASSLGLCPRGYESLPRAAAFGSHSESMPCVCPLHSLQDSSHRPPPPMSLAPSSQGPDHLAKPLTTAPSFWLSLSSAKGTAREMLGLPPVGRTLLGHSPRGTVLTGWSCSGSLRAGAPVACRTACTRI